MIKRLLISLALLSAALSLHAQGTYMVFAENESLSKVMGMISAQCDYRFVYNNDFIDTSRKVSVHVSSDSLEDILSAVFDPCGIKVTIVGKQIALSVPEIAELPQSSSAARGRRVVKGVVFERSGDPLAGADIYVEGTKNGTYSDINGCYSIDIPDDPSIELTFNFFGMQQVRETVGRRSQINVILDDASQALDQIVVTGYQTLSRERSAGSFANISGEAVRDQANVHGNLLRSLEGRVAGLNVSETADGVSYLIRGVSSINATTEPLFIVDGIAMTRSQMEKMLNPNDVESINFLKDATAASIWGAQAANGVIVVTTKTGSGKGDLHVSYNGSFTYKGKPIYAYQDMMTSREFIETAMEVFDPQTYKWNDINTTLYGLTGGNYRVVFPHEDAMYRYYNGEISLDERDAALERLASRDGRKEYEKYFMSGSYLTNHSLSFSGGNDRSNYYLSFEYQRDNGAYRDHTQEYKLFFRDVLRLADWARLDISLSTYQSGSRSFSATHLPSLPYVTYYDESGSELSLADYVMAPEYRKQIEAATGRNLDYYAVSDYLGNTSSSKSLGANANLGLKIDLAKFLSYEGRFQYSMSKDDSEHFIPAGSFYVREELALATGQDGVCHLPTSGGHYTVGNSRLSSYTVRNQLNLDLAFGADGQHSITALAGFEFRDRLNGSYNCFLRGYDLQTMQHIMYDDYSLNTTGVVNPVLPSFTSANSNHFDPNDYTQRESEFRFVSLYANAAYTFKDKYSVNASIRVDQSNLFGSDPSVQFKPIWSVGAIWNASKEDFLKRGWLDRLNIRASYGFAGNSPNPGEGGPYNILSSTSDAAYSRFGLGYVVVTPANDKLTWEKTRTINFGIDWAVLGNRLGGSIDLYDKNTTNLLAQTPVDPTSGFTTVLSNVGRMTNRGIELSVNSVNVRKGLFEWDTDFSFTYNANKLVSMYVEPPTTAYAMIGYDYWEGFPFGTVFAYNWAGLDPADGMPRVYDSQGNAVRLVSDVDTLEAVPYQGTTVAPLFGSMSNSFSFGNFDLSFMFIYNFGHVMRDDINSQSSYRLCGNLHRDFAKRWKSPGDEEFTNVPAYYSLKNTGINETDVTYLYRYADINILDASYIKLRELSFGYRLPAPACNAIHARNASVRIQASNLFTIAFNGQGIDPECFYFSGGRSDKFPPFVSASLNIEF